MPTPLNIDTGRRDDGRLVVRASGELDMSNIDVFSDAVLVGLTALPYALVPTSQR